MVLLAGATACGSGDGVGASLRTKLDAAHSACSSELGDMIPMDGSIELADGGKSLLFSDVKYDAGVKAIACMFVQLKTSEALVSNLDSTTAMMGRQSAEDHGLKYEWSYHPDNGINMTITEE